MSDSFVTFLYIRMIVETTLIVGMFGSIVCGLYLLIKYKDKL